MVKVNFIRDNETISVDMLFGRTIMEAAKELGLPEIPKLWWLSSMWYLPCACR